MPDSPPTPDERTASDARRVPQDPAGQALAKLTLRTSGRRASRTGAMGALLDAQRTHINQCDAARAQLPTAQDNSRPVEAATYSSALAAEGWSAFFRKLDALGYNGTTTWDELTNWLPTLYAQARLLADAPPLDFARADSTTVVFAAYAAHLTEGASRFVQAAEPAMYFLRDDEDDA